jgi:hypothetical protein
MLGEKPVANPLFLPQYQIAWAGTETRSQRKELGDTKATHCAVK